MPNALSRLVAAWRPAHARAATPVMAALSAPDETKASRAGALIAIESLRRPVWTPRDYTAFAREGYMQNAVVYRSVRMVAEAAASVPVLLYDGDNEIESHPLIDLIARPAPQQSAADFFEAWYGYLLVAGNVYAEAVAMDGSLRELHVLRPDRMKVIPGPDGWPEAHEYTVAGNSVRFDEEPVDGVAPILHLKLFHPVNDHYGMSPLEAAATAIDIHNTAAEWNKALLDNSARPSGALVYTGGEGRMTGEQFERLKAELETGFQGARQAGRPLLLEGGLDWKALGLSPKDMDFIEAKNAAAREIALALGVPPMLLGIPGDNTYANYQEAQRAFWRQTVLPLFNRTMKALSAWLSPAWNEVLELRGDLDQIEALTIEREALWARLQGVSFLTDDEKRAAIGYGPMPAAPAMEMPAAAELMEQDPGPFDDGSAKFNPYHDELGRFTNAEGAVQPAGARGGGRNQRGPLKKIYDYFARRAGSRPFETATKTPGDILTHKGRVGSLKGDLQKLSHGEKAMVEELVTLGNDVELLTPRSDQGIRGRTNDWRVNGEDWEFKESNTKSSEPDVISRSIAQQINDGSGQSKNVLISARKVSGMTRGLAERAIARAAGNDPKEKIQSITILTRDGPVIVKRR